MVKLLVVMNCGTKIYKTGTFKDKESFKNYLGNLNMGNIKLVRFTDIYGTFVAVSPFSCLIECEDCKE